MYVINDGYGMFVCKLTLKDVIHGDLEQRES